MEEQTNEALWYVVHTYSGYENKVANDLQTMVENTDLRASPYSNLSLSRIHPMTHK